MPKRRAVSIVSDDEDVSRESSPVPKRARTDEDSEQNVEVSARQSTKRERSKGKARRRDEEEAEEEDDDDDNNVGQTAPDEDEEKQFEEENEEVIRERLMSKGKTQGGIAEMGIIESIEMHQFMCHKYLTFTFGPQINFIIGAHSRGKSAVLSALTVALGGKATSTGRGNGLKSFIREGQAVSEVTVVLKNQGEEAYRQNEYGKSIVITRRFTKEGASSYKIRSKDGRVISTKREELSAICDHMNIQVDNPMNILTQGLRRQFLSASQPADKYKFFLKGTQLSQLSEEYQTCLENIGQTQKVLTRKSEAIPELEEALEEATSRFQEAHKAREQRHKADELKKELAWAHVAAKEKEMRAKMEEVEAYEADLNGMGEIEHLRGERSRLQDPIKANKSEIQKKKNEEKSMNDSLTKLRKQIADFEERIAAEKARIEGLTKGKRDETNRKLEKAQLDYAKAESELEALRAEKARKLALMQEIEQQGRAAEAERNNAKERVVQTQEQLTRCNAREKNKLAPFGNNMDQVLKEIERMNWFGNRPVGPFGLYVNVKDAERWAPLMRVQLGGMMSGFAVSDARDRMALDALLKRYGNQNINIVIAEVDLFDYSRGEPPEGIPTVLRTLDVSDEYVLRLLINAMHIEGTLIAPTRREADELLQRVGRGLAWSGDLYTVRRYPEGGGSSNPLQPLRQGDPRQQLFTGGDIAGEKRRWEQEVAAAERELVDLSEKIDGLRAQYQKLNQEVKALSSREDRLDKKVKELKALRDTLVLESNEDTPSSVQLLEQAKADLEADKDATIAQFKVLEQRIAELNALQRPLVEKSEKIRKQIQDFEGERSRITKQIEDAVSVRLLAQRSKQYYLEKLQNEENAVKIAQEAADNLQTEFESWTEKAEQYCERFPNPRDADEVQRNLEAVQTALKEREKRHGASVEEMTIEVNKKKAALETAKKDLKNMLALNRALKKSVKVRLTKWHDFRRHIALRCKVYFSYHLSNRGYYGKVIFNHVSGTLQLKASHYYFNDVINSREKDPRSLSGGEKSFSTICLLLSLWESIGCPIRCLDEFDVFMDAVNRRISMKMMIDTANASDRKQYVLITPQDMTNINVGNTVRVHRMSDPERGQAIFRKMKPYAAANNLRLVLLNKQAAAIKARGFEFAAFMRWFIETEDIPPLSEIPGTDGTVSLLAHAYELPDETETLLNSYFRSFIVFDCSQTGLGFPPLPGLYSPPRDPKAVNEETKEFPTWGAIYFTQVITRPDEDADSPGFEEMLPTRKPVHEMEGADPRFMPTTLGMTPEERAEVTDAEAVWRSQRLILGMDVSVFRENVLRAFFECPVDENTGGEILVWPRAKVHSVWCDMSPGDDVYGGNMLKQIAREYREKGRGRSVEVH
ncbi:hypothetical protein IEO21_09462 [Rhodonia placenta]|uniref:RecF/RecN/SMC N-terminal domain-containing protein n=1 Tax=Rhodonia placenta TaxID=104341 RepID=A0A8H7NUC7_9APHY|nr:hypothetical protein IEO21_09462 [Postia placenta]